MIKKVTNKIDADKCDLLLNKLILDEKQYDETIDENFVVSNYFNNIIDNPNNVLLAYYIEDEIVGYILIKNLNTNDKVCLLDGLYVEENYRNKGIANQLINEALNISKENNCKYVDINVMYKNELAKEIYKKLGFNEFKLNLRKEI